jgi:tetratricopeptide (TPR) repeat protein
MNTLHSLPLATNEIFFERKTLLDELITKQQQQHQIIFISGPTGSGKTKLAIDYVKRLRNNQSNIRYFPAFNEDVVNNEYMKLCEILNVNESDRKFRICCVNSRLEVLVKNDNNNLIFFFDDLINFNDIKDLISELPSSITLLITSCNSNLVDFFASPPSSILNVKVEPFSMVESISYVNLLLSERDDQNRKLLKDFNFFIEKHLKNLKENELIPFNLNKIAFILRKKKNLKFISSLDLSQLIAEYYNEIYFQADNSIDCKLMECLPYLDPSSIDLRLLLPQLTQNDKKEDLIRSIKNLKNNYIITSIDNNNDDETVTISLHRQTQIELNEFFKSKELSKKIDNAQNEILEVLNRLFKDFETRSINKTSIVYNHIIYIVNDKVTNWFENNSQLELNAQLLTKLSSYYSQLLYETDKMRQVLHKSLAMRQILYNTTDTNAKVAKSLNNLGLAYQENPIQINESIKYMLEALKMYKQLYKAPNLRIATVLNNVGLAYQEKGDLTIAIKYLTESFEMRRSIYRGNHSKIADSLNNIGSAYKKMGKTSESIKYLKESLEMYLELYSNNNYRIAISLNNIGFAYKQDGNYSESIKYHKDALKVYRQIFKGNDSIKIAISLNNLGLISEQAGSLNDGISYFEEALTMFKRIYPEMNHPHTAMVLCNLGISNQNMSMNENEKALMYLEEALNIFNCLNLENISGVIGETLSKEKLKSIIESLKPPLKEDVIQNEIPIQDQQPLEKINTNQLKTTKYNTFLIGILLLFISCFIYYLIF